MKLFAVGNYASPCFINREVVSKLYRHILLNTSIYAIVLMKENVLLKKCH